MDDTKHDDHATDDVEEAATDDEVTSPQVDETDIETEAEVEPAERKGGRGWRIAAIVAVLAAATSLGVLGSLLLGGESGGPGGDVLACIPSRDFTEGAKKSGDTCPPKGAPYTDGLVQKSESGSFTLQPIRQGSLGKELKLTVREPDRAYIDVAHAQTHAALGQPVRVYTKKHEGQEVVIYMVDSPLLGGGMG